MNKIISVIILLPVLLLSFIILFNRVRLTSLYCQLTCVHFNDGYLCSCVQSWIWDRGYPEVVRQ